MNYYGKKYGHLKMIRPSRKGGHGVGAIWVVRCDCGVEKEVIARQVSRGRILTCGTCIYYKELRGRGKGLTTRQRREYTAHLAQASSEGVKSDITSTEFHTYLAGDCSICGEPPKEGKLKIERVDTKQNYTPDNCITSCSSCRKMRGNLSIQEFLDHIIKIYNKCIDTAPF